MVLIHISLMTNVVEHFSSVYLPLVYPLFMKCLSLLLIFFLILKFLLVTLIDK